jgi:hypothetical protein
MKDKFTSLDSFFYYLGCIVTLGGYFLLKVVVKKAISEMKKD